MVKVLTLSKTYDKTLVDDIYTKLQNQPSTNIRTYINTITNQIATIFNKAANSTFTNNNNTSSTKYYSPYKKGHSSGPQCKKARRLYNMARKKYHVHKTNTNKHRLKTASVFYKQTVNTFQHKYHGKHKKTLRNMASKRPKDYWRYIKSINRYKTDKTPSITEFYNHYKHLNSLHDIDNGDSPSITLPDIDTSSLNNPILESEIRKCILKVQNGKAVSELDHISNEYLKSTQNIMLPLYARLFNIILDTGVLPETWLSGAIKPIFKNKGSPLDPKNYRPITILSCLGKIFTAVLNCRIQSFMETNRLLCENQAGFRSDYSTTDHIFTLQFLVEKLKSCHKKLYCSFVDFSSAFDSVWRSGLWWKLAEIGVNGKIFDIIRNMYSDIKSFVSNNGQTSMLFHSYSGVRQGENLSPILFSIFLNDVEKFIDQPDNGTILRIENEDVSTYLKILILLYADDMVILEENPISFQRSLDNFDIYFNAWKLKNKLRDNESLSIRY